MERNVIIERTRFNSMIVRLKEPSEVSKNGLMPKFQFYDSPIKREKTLD